MGSNCSNQQIIKFDVAELSCQDIQEPYGCATLQDTYTRPCQVSFPSERPIKDQPSTDVEHIIQPMKKPRVKLHVNAPKKQSIETTATKSTEMVVKKGILKKDRCHSSDHYNIDKHVRFVGFSSGLTIVA